MSGTSGKKVGKNTYIATHQGKRFAVSSAQAEILRVVNSCGGKVLFPISWGRSVRILAALNLAEIVTDPSGPRYVHVPLGVEVEKRC